MNKRYYAPIIALFIFATTLLVPSTAQAAWYDGRATSRGIFIAATYAETQLGWGKYAPPSLDQPGPSCVAYATGNALRMLLVKEHGWTKDLQWRPVSSEVYQTIGKNPHAVASHLNWPGYRIIGSHPDMYATAFFEEVTATQEGITYGLTRGPVAFAVNAYDGTNESDRSHEIVAVYADPVKGLLIQNSWGVGWLGTGFAWVQWPYVSTYVAQDWSHLFRGSDGYRP